VTERLLPPYTVKGRAVVLFEQDGVRLAVRLTGAVVSLTAIVDEPDIIPMLGFHRPSTVTGYEVEVTGLAPGFTIWDGNFDEEPEAIEQHRPEVTA